MIRNIRRGRRFVESADRIASVDDLIDAIEEYSGERHTKSELENKNAMCSVYSQAHGGQQVLVCLRGNTLTCYYYNLNSVVDDCVEKTAYALSGEDPENIPAIMEELMTYLEESWTDDLDMYGRISIPCRKEALFSFFESSCEDVDNYILHLADSHCSDVQELLESDEDEDEDEYEERRSRKEARNRMRSRILNRRR